MDRIDFTSGAPTTGDLDVRWIHGVPRRSGADEPPIQTHAYDEHTVILRQSKTVHFEAPFMYLLFGNDRAMLIDTGATEDPDRFPLRRTVDELIDDWLGRHPREGYELVVAHTHAHGDHRAGDDQFADRPDTDVVGKDLPDVHAHFGFDDTTTPWPDGIVSYDLGDRRLEITGIPGHHATSIALHDPWTGFLLTGDTVLPGRLYVTDSAAFLDSLDRLVTFAEERSTTHVLGCHVEMTSLPGRDYPMGCTYQPDEAPLPMPVERITTVRDAMRRVASRRGLYTFDDFIIVNNPGHLAAIGYVLRNLWRRLRTPRSP